MRSSALFCLVLSLILLLPACLYVHTFEPLTVDMNRTPVAAVEKTGSVKLISFPAFPLGSYDLVAWGNTGIARVAKEQGMQEVYFADVEILSILRIWNEYTLHVYGK